MFHGFDYPDEIGGDALLARFSRITMNDGVISFNRPELCEIKKRVRAMSVKPFGLEKNLRTASSEWSELEEQT